MWNEIRTLFAAGSSSREEAKGRLHIVLAHDRTGLDGAKLQKMREELALVISKYVPIDATAVEIEVERVTRESKQLRVSSPLRAR